MRRRGVYECLGYSGGHGGQHGGGGMGWNAQGPFEGQQQRMDDFQGNQQRMFQQDLTRIVNMGNVIGNPDDMMPFGGDRRPSSGISDHMMGNVNRTAPNVLNMDINSPMPMSLGQMMNIGAQLSAVTSNRNRGQMEFTGHLLDSRTQQDNQRFVQLSRKRPGDEDDFVKNPVSFKRRSQGFNLSSGEISSSQPGEKSGFCCQVCKVQFATIQEFDDHMESRDHAIRMGVYTDTNIQLLNTVKFGGQSDLRSPPSKTVNMIMDSDHCSLCDRPFGIGFSKDHHNGSKEHRRRRGLVVNGCRYCSVDSFSNYSEYLRHIQGASHKRAKNEQNPDVSKDTSGGSNVESSRSTASGSNVDSTNAATESLELKKKKLTNIIKAKVAAANSAYDSPTQSEEPTSMEVTVCNMILMY